MKHFILLLVSLLTLSSSLKADDTNLNNIPDSLKEWIPWVKDELTNLECVRINNSTQAESPQFECLWLGKAEVNITNNKATFKIKAHNLSNATELLELPSGYGLHLSNLDITKDNTPFNSYALKKTETTLELPLPKGSYEIKGEIIWDKLPNQIPLTKSYGLVEISVDLEDKNLIAKREADHIAIVSNQGIAVADSMRTEVYRRLKDGSPLIMETRLKISISGKTRIEDFGNFLPKNSSLVEINGPLQSFVDSNNNVKIKVSQGNYYLIFTSILEQPCNLIEFSKDSNINWPNEETWIWVSDQELRSVELKGVTSINASQAHLPEDWQSESALVVTSLDTIELEQKRRGEERPGTDTLSLNRTIWPNLYGNGLTISDDITSSFKGSFRLNATDELKLGRVNIDDNPMPITLDPKSQKKGVEIRKENQTITATSQLSSDSSLSATGWDHTFENVNIKVNIPPSWKLFYAKGVTEAYGTWVSSWSIFDVFILAILVIFTQQIMGMRLALLYLAFSVIGRTEFMLPTVFFSYIVVLVALLKLTSEKSSRYVLLPLYFCIALSFLALLIQGISFAKLQTIQILHPQLQSGTRYRTMFQSALSLIDAMPLSWILFLVGIAVSVFIIRWCFMAPSPSGKIFRLFMGLILILMSSSILTGIGGLIFAPKYRGEQFSMPSEYAPSPTRRLKATASIEDSLSYSKSDIEKLEKPQTNYKSRTIQAGPSLPSWTWRSINLSISGPISADHQIELIFIKPWLQKILSVLRLFLVFSLIALLAKYLISILKDRDIKIQNIIAKQTTAVVILCCLFFSQGKNVQADIPDSNLLDKLKNRIVETTCKEHTCSSLDSMEIELNKNDFKILLTANSKGNSLISIPGTLEDLNIIEVSINDSVTSYLKVSNQFLQVKLGDGRNNVAVKGILPEKNALSIKIPLKPLHLKINSEYWDIGAYDQGGSNEVIQVSRLATDSSTTKAVSESPKYNTENWILVERKLKIGDQITSEGTISRIGDLSRDKTVLVPLKESEQLTIADLISKDRNIIATFKAGESVLHFESTFNTSDNLTLNANKLNAFSETWHIECEDYISCEFSGRIAPSRRLDSEGNNVYTFIPFPTETITIIKTPLNSAEGDSLNIQSINHTINWGESVLSGKLLFSVLNTKQNKLEISFSDPSISIESVTLDGQTDSRPFPKPELNLLLEPESKAIEVNYRRINFSPALNETAPLIKLNSKAGNVETVVNTSKPAWLIWLDGSSWGPAVLIWSKIVASLLILVILRKFSLLSISTPSLIGIAFALSLMPTIILPIPLLWISLVRESKIKKFVSANCPRFVQITLLSTLSVLSVGIIFLIIRLGLLGDPPLLVAGNSSTLTSLKWYTDFCGDNATTCSLPAPWILSLPIFYWRGLTLLVSLFLTMLTVSLIKDTAQIVRGSE